MAERNEQNMVNFKIDSVVKESAEAVLSGMGLNVSAYLGMCMRKLAQDQEIPFDLKVDADFWLTEAQVSRAASLIKSGNFDKAWKIRLIVNDILDDCLTAAWMRIVQNSKAFDGGDSTEEAVAINNDFNMARALLFGIVAEYKGKSLTGLFGKNDMANKDLSMANEMEEVIGRNNSCLGTGLPIFLEKLSSSSKTFEQMVEESGICGGDGVLPSGASLAEKAAAIDDILSIVFCSYKNHRSQLAMRFVGSEAYMDRIGRAWREEEDLKTKASEEGVAENLKRVTEDRWLEMKRAAEVMKEIR